MPEVVNTTPLGATVEDPSIEDDRPVMVEVDHVSMIFNMASQQLNSLKEYAIALAKRELMFKEFRALDDVSFTVRKGDVFGILGTNGSGKSTVLKIIAGVLEPTKGSCSIHGNIAPLIELGAGFDMELTARENIYLNGALLGYPRKFIDQNFDEIVSFAEIEKFLDMPMKNYSSGMVARIAFAIATVIVPEILIVDEVLSVGDFMFQQKCERRIMKLIKEYGVTVLIVSHNNDQIAHLCNKAIWIEKGHTRMFGTAEEVCRTYRVLGGHTGDPESEKTIYTMLNSPIKPNPDIITTINSESCFGVAAKLVEKCNFEPGGSVLLASNDYPLPCMAAQGLSGILGAPILLTKQDRLPDVIAQSLRQLKPKQIVLLGGEEIISDQIVKQLEDASESTLEITRIDSNESVDLCCKIYEYGKVYAQEHNVTGWTDTAVLGHHDCVGDLISLSPYLVKMHIPVFFIEENGKIGDANEKFLLSNDFNNVIVLAWYDHVPDTFIDQCAQRNINARRLTGADAYHANKLINDLLTSGELFDEAITINDMIVTTVWNPADSYAAGAYAAQTSSAFLLVDPQNLDSTASAIKYITDKKGAIKSLTFIGDYTQFSDLDKEILAKAVTLAQPAE